MGRGEQQNKNLVEARRVPDEPQVIEEGAWQMWALPHDDGFSDPGHRKFSEAYSQHGIKPVPVIVRENSQGSYYGWLQTNHEIPVMIYGIEGLFRMCFPYGPDKEEEQGNGRALRLTIEAL